MPAAGNSAPASNERCGLNAAALEHAGGNCLLYAPSPGRTVHIHNAAVRSVLQLVAEKVSRRQGFDQFQQQLDCIFHICQRGRFHRGMHIAQGDGHQRGGHAVAGDVDTVRIRSGAASGGFMLERYFVLDRKSTRLNSSHRL